MDNNSTELKNIENIRISTIPNRICLAGGWMDQQFLNKHAKGTVVVANLDSNLVFNDRSGLATSSRKTAQKLWSGKIPLNQNPETLAKTLYKRENSSPSKYISGAQDQIGLLVPGISKLIFERDSIWPKIITINCKEIINWIENVIELIPLKPRPLKYNPLEKINIDHKNIQKLGHAGEKCFLAIKEMNIELLGESLMDTWKMWQKILPNTVNDEIISEGYKNNKYGFSFTGSYGGYIIRVKAIREPFLPKSVQIKVKNF